MIYKSLINRLKIIYKHDYEKFSKMLGNESFMTLRMIRILWLRRSLKEKQSVVKRCQQVYRIKISIFIHIKGEGKAISETAKENTGIRWKVARRR